jgi:hypothetical protein
MSDTDALAIHEIIKHAHGGEANAMPIDGLAASEAELGECLQVSVWVCMGLYVM